MKLIKSKCQKAWFFNVEVTEHSLKAGLACFLSGCDIETQIEYKGQKFLVATPGRFIQSPVPGRIVNARLSVLSLDGNE